MKSETLELLLKALQTYSTKEFNRQWSVVLKEGILHSSIRCSKVDGGDLSYNSSISTQDIISLTLPQILSSDRHCPSCALSFLPSGFNFLFFSKVYKPYLELLQSSPIELPAKLYSQQFTQNFTATDLFNIYIENINNFNLHPLPQDLVIFPRSHNLSLLDYRKYIYIKEDFILTPISNITSKLANQHLGSIKYGALPATSLKDFTYTLAETLPSIIDFKRFNATTLLYFS